MSACSTVQIKKAREANLNTSALAECVMYQNNERHLRPFSSSPPSLRINTRALMPQGAARLSTQPLTPFPIIGGRGSAGNTRPPHLFCGSSLRGQRPRAVSFQVDLMTLHVSACPVQTQALSVTAGRRLCGKITLILFSSPGYYFEIPSIGAIRINTQVRSPADKSALAIPRRGLSPSLAYDEADCRSF